MTWSSTSRLIEPISRSTYEFRHPDRGAASQPQASVVCRAIHSAVGISVTPSHMIRRRPCRRTRKPYSAGKKLSARRIGPSRRCRRRDCKERFSSPVRALAFPGQVLGNARLADIDAELEQFAVDAGCAPARVGKAHVPDQLTDLHWHSRSPAAPSGFPAPERSKSSTVPTNHGLGLDDGQRIYNARNETPKPNKHQTV